MFSCIVCSYLSSKLYIQKKLILIKANKLSKLTILTRWVLQNNKTYIFIYYIAFYATKQRTIQKQNSKKYYLMIITAMLTFNTKTKKNISLNPLYTYIVQNIEFIYWSSTPRTCLFEQVIIFWVGKYCIFIDDLKNSFLLSTIVNIIMILYFVLKNFIDPFMKKYILWLFQYLEQYTGFFIHFIL